MIARKIVIESVFLAIIYWSKELVGFSQRLILC